MSRPLYVYDNWSAYDELSDNVLLTEELAMGQFEHVVRLRRLGLAIDAYLMDAFWYAPDGGYLTWRPERWPNGPDVWLEACMREGILPGLWFTANTAFFLNPPAAWRDSLSSDNYGFSCSKGGFLSGFVGVLGAWYQRGVRVFKFDFAEFSAVPASESQDPDARKHNIAAFRAALTMFRTKHPDAILLAYNGFEDTEYMPWTDRPVRHVFDRDWMTIFESVYCGDPRPAGVPLPDFWRSLDVYADAQVFLLHRGGLALEEIDNCAFMIGVTGTCYQRGNAGWKTTALLSYARGGRVHMMLGNLDALSSEDVRWLVHAQSIFETAGVPSWIGGNPGQGELYGYAANDIVTVVNPSLVQRSLTVGDGYWLTYSDGHVTWDNNTISLGAGAVALLTRGGDQLGQLPPKYGSLTELGVEWMATSNSMEGVIEVPAGHGLHLVFNQFDQDGRRRNTTGGAPPTGISMAKLLQITVTCNGLPLEVSRPDDRVAWSGLSWAYGIVSPNMLAQCRTVNVRFDADDANVATITATAYADAAL